jgi:hypothetical protein
MWPYSTKDACEVPPYKRGLNRVECAAQSGTAFEQYEKIISWLRVRLHNYERTNFENGTG